MLAQFTYKALSGIKKRILLHRSCLSEREKEWGRRGRAESISLMTYADRP